MIKFTKTFKKKKCVLLTKIPPLSAFGQDQIWISLEFQPSIGIIIDHQHLWSQLVEEGIIIFDNWSSYVPGHELTPPQYSWIYWSW